MAIQLLSNSKKPKLCGTTFTLVDTAGVDGERISLLTSGDKVRNRDPMEVEMMRHTLKAAGDADLLKQDRVISGSLEHVGLPHC